MMKPQRKEYAGTRRLENAKAAIYASVFSTATQKQLDLLGVITRREYVHLLRNISNELEFETKEK